MSKTNDTSAPEWCNPGAYAVITDLRADGLGMWRAVEVTSVTSGVITVRATPPYAGRYDFPVTLGEPGQVRVRLLSDPGWYLAAADDPTVIAQRAARDEAKHGEPGASQWVLTEDRGWQVKVPDLMEALEASFREAKAARRRPKTT